MEPATYFPVGPIRRKFEHEPLGTDYGNGPLDARLFQLDRTFADYRTSKFSSLRQRRRHVCRHPSFAPVERAVASFAADRLVREYPAVFSLHGNVLRCAHTGEYVRTDSLDGLALQVQEDLCVQRVTQTGNWLAYAHVCFPSKWDPREKIGRSMAQMHAPIPHMDPVNRAMHGFLLRLRRNEEPIVQFVWGLSEDGALNHHPEHPVDPEGLYLRVERQALWPIPSTDAVLFAIRTYVTPFDALAHQQQEQIRSAVECAHPDDLAYKGITGSLRERLYHNR